MRDLQMPVHPTKRHPLTGEPIQAIWVSPSGRVCWPVMGAAEGDDDGSGGTGGGDGGAGSGDGSQGGAGGQGAGGGQQTKNATDDQGNDLGYPKDTPTAEMSDKEQTAYWRHKAHKHEGRVKNLVGDRTPEQVKKDLEELAELKKQQQTPAEQAINDAREQGKTEGVSSERAKSATAIFRGALEAGGLEGDELDEMVSNFNVAGYITDDGIDTTKITNFAKRFSTSGKDTRQERRRDFGGGHRRDGGSGSERGSAGKAEADRRFKKDKQTSTSGE